MWWVLCTHFSTLAMGQYGIIHYGKSACIRTTTFAVKDTAIHVYS
jgi:hypothetical protein